MIALVRKMFQFLRRMRALGPVAILIAATVVGLLALAAFEHEAHVRRVSLSWHEALYYTFGLFTLEGNPLGYPRTIGLQVVYFAAPLVTASALLGAITEILAERAPLYFGRFRNHMVVAGMGNLGTSIVHDAEYSAQRHVAIDRDRGCPSLADVQAGRYGSAVVGDMTSAEVLRRAGCAKARVVFLTAPSDIINLDAAFRIRRLAQQQRVRRPPAIFAHVFDAGLADALGRHLQTDEPTEADIVPFNSYRFAAKALLALLVRDGLVPGLRLGGGLRLLRTAWPDDGTTLHEPPPSDLDAHLQEDRRRLLRAFRLTSDQGASDQRFAVIGLGRFGRSVAAELLGCVADDARFLIVEQSSASCERQLGTFTLEQRRRFRVLIGDATSPDTIEAIEAFHPRVVLVCTDNDLGNLRLALDLQRNQIKTVSRMFDLDAAAELARGLEERGVMTVGLSRLFRAAIPILLYERRLLACINLDVQRTPDVDHLFYLAHVTPQERNRLGHRCVDLREVPCDAGLPTPPTELALVWGRAVDRLDPRSPGE